MQILNPSLEVIYYNLHNYLITFYSSNNCLFSDNIFLKLLATVVLLKGQMLDL